MLSLGLDADYSWRRREPEVRQITWADFPGVLLNGSSAAGPTVNADTAFQVSAVWNAVDLISSDVARLPRHLYRRLEDDSRERIDTGPTARILDDPNDEARINELDFWKTIVAAALFGGGYAEIEYDKALRPIRLWPLLPGQCVPKYGPTVIDGNPYAGRYYLWRGQVSIHPDDIFDIHGMGGDGMSGYPVVEKAKQSLGLSLALEKFAASFFGNGAWPGVLLEHPKTLSPGAAERLKVGWDRLKQGPDRAHSTAVLEEGMKASVMGTEPQKSQMTESREDQILEVARWWNIPPHKLKHKMGERPGGNLTESEQDYLSSTLDVWLIRIEQECRRKLIAKPMRATQYVEHDRNALLRMFWAARGTSYKTYFDMGVLDAEQIAKKENLPKPKPKEPMPPVSDPKPPGPPPANARTLAADRANLVDVVSRFVRREASAARRAAKKGPAAFSTWADEFYRDEVVVLRGFLVPAVRLSLACRGLDGDAEEVSAGLATRYVERSKDDLLALPAKDLETRADALVSRWETTRGGDLAEQILALQPEELRARTAPATVNVTVNVPEQAPPNVTVETHNHVPPVPPAAITFRGGDVNVPPQMTPDINVNVPTPLVRVDAPVTVNVPSPAPLKVERDANGAITGIRKA